MNQIDFSALLMRILHIYRSELLPGARKARQLIQVLDPPACPATTMTAVNIASASHGSDVPHEPVRVSRRDRHDQRVACAVVSAG
jgi:hypothetical protein